MVRKSKRWDEELLEENDSIYDNANRSHLVDDDAMSTEEEAFMIGYEQALDGYDDDEEDDDEIY